MAFNSVSHLVFDYHQQVDESNEFLVFESSLEDDVLNGTNILEDEWNSYYEQDEYDDSAWTELGGVNVMCG
jgi:hypothetical protein